ncbi:MAG TPA: magnesium/cobalt transporter CorA [Sedimentisphaerales bacterium]|nr:magnesium/cobalt transporter CorA [Sedimentisphaerales bacterium]
MAKVSRKRSAKAGLPPGTLVHIGERKTEQVRITVIDYDEANFQEKQVASIEECFEFKATPTVTWINIDGLHQVDIIDKLGRQFELHPLILEDILSTGQRPKFEDFESYAFIVLKMLSYNGEKYRVEAEQVSMVLGSNFVLSFQESIGDVFDQVRDRIRNSKGRIRKMGADYLVYSLMDAVVDNYFLILERFGERIEFMEEELVADPTEKTLGQIHNLKREMISLRKSVWPLREAISALERSESSLIKESTGVYLRDVYDHTIQVIDTVETFRDMVSGMLDIYLSSISNKMNAVMKVLTIIATIFIPLSFFAGVYGMNFRYMPGLEWRWSYYVFCLIMSVIGIGMLIWFRRKRWL